MLHSRSAHLRVARTVAYEQSIEVHACEIIVPWHSYHSCVTLEQTSYNIMLYTTVYKNDFVLSAAVSNNLLARHFLNPVDFRRVEEIDFVILKLNLSLHGSLLSYYLSQSTCVNACQGRDFLSLEPFAERLHSVPVAVLLRVVGHNKTLDVYLVALELLAQSFCLETHFWDSVIAH